jgi:hypothetical protein
MLPASAFQRRVLLPCADDEHSGIIAPAAASIPVVVARTLTRGEPDAKQPAPVSCYA